MSYGLRVLNQSGYVQVDENFANYLIVAKGTWSVGTSGLNVDLGTYGTGALLFVRYKVSTLSAWDNIAGVSSVYQGGGQKYKIVIGDYLGGPLGLGYPLRSGTVDYIIARVTSNAPSSNSFGMRVWTPSGQLSFDSGYEYIKLRSGHAFSDAYSNTNYRFSSAQMGYKNNYYLCPTASGTQGETTGIFIITGPSNEVKVNFYDVSGAEYLQHYVLFLDN